MSQRMTDADATKFVRLMRLNELFDAAVEFDRARSEEARLLEERVELDAKVQAMADALGGTADATLPDGPCWCLTEDVSDHAEACEMRRAALRLVGR